MFSFFLISLFLSFFFSFEFKFCMLIIMEILFSLLFFSFFMFNSIDMIFVYLLSIMVCDSCLGLSMLINYMRGCSKCFVFSNSF